MKIYNEIIIDMNPESHSYKEVLHEDSFEYNGDVMFAQMKVYNEGDKVLSWDDRKEVTQGSYRNGVRTEPTYSYKLWEWSGDAWVFAGWTDASSDHPTVDPKYSAIETVDSIADMPLEMDLGTTGWGAENITKDMFIKPDGTPRKLGEIYKKLDPILTGITGQDLLNQISELLPKYVGAAEEEKGFLKTEKEFAKEQAGVAREADIYGLQKEAQAKAGEAGAQMRGVYGGMGGAMRGAIGAKADIGKGFAKGMGDIESAYDLSQRKADFDYTRGIYDLDKTAAGEFETDVEASWMEDEFFAAAGETPQVDPSFVGKKGGRVPTREETFLDFLTKLPDAGGN